MLTIGIAGGTGAGKTSLCGILARTIGPAAILDLDSYYLDRSGMSPAERARLNFDEPAAFDLPLLVRHVCELRDGHPVRKPEYSFEHHTRCGSRVVAPAAVLLVEGLFTFWWEELRSLLDVKVFVDAPESMRLSRRLQRDVATRGRTSESVHAQLRATVWPMHTQYVEPTRRLADLVVRNDRDLAECAAAVCDTLERTVLTDARGREPHASA